MTIQDVFRAFYSRYIETYPVSPMQMKAASCIINCKNGGMGLNKGTCSECGDVQIHYNSCRNRHCPMCMEFERLKWVEQMKEYSLDAPYFHVVFTLPHELNDLLYANQTLLYNLIYTAAADTLKELAADKRYLGAKIGFVSLFHSWGGSLNFHPHLHCIVMGGGLNQKNQWTDRGDSFFLPVEVISRLFRGKYLAQLTLLKKKGKLCFTGSAQRFRNSYEWSELIRGLYATEWVPYCGRTFGGHLAVIEYLGRYSNRVALSNSRIVSISGDNVTFLAKDTAQSGVMKEETISGVEFIRRFLMHILPKRFVKIRYYGLLGNRFREANLTLCRNLLGCKKYISELKDMDAADIIKHLYGIKSNICRCCGGELTWKRHRRVRIRADTE